MFFVKNMKILETVFNSVYVNNEVKRNLQPNTLKTRSDDKNHEHD